MSFSSQSKNEMIKSLPKSNCCKSAMLYGSLLLGKLFNQRAIEFNTEHEDMIKHLKSLLSSVFGDEINAYVIEKQNAKFKTVYTLHIVDEDDILKVFHHFGHSMGEVSLHISGKNFFCDNCKRAFLTGAFLACGRVTTPEKEYHLEFTTSKLRLSENLMELLTQLGFSPKKTKRGNDYVLYFKDSVEIEDLLTMLGAPNKSLELMNTKIYKELRNQANRSSNCDIANQEKTTATGNSQVKDIDFIFAARGYDFLPAQLQEVALLRKLNPESPLSELAQLSDLGLSKSGINHRLTKIKAIAAAIRMEDDISE